MESKEYFEKVMQDYNQNRKGRSLRKYCKDEAVDYDWLIQYKKNYPLQEKQQEPSQDAFIPITIKDVAPKPTTQLCVVQYLTQYFCDLQFVWQFAYVVPNIEIVDQA